MGKFAFSQNFTVENMESVKSIAESNFKMCLTRNIQGVNDKDILPIFYRSLQLVCKFKNYHTDFPDFPDLPEFQLWENSNLIILT